MASLAVGAKDTSAEQAAAQKAAEMAAKKLEANRQLEAELAEGSNKGMNSKKKKPEDPNAIKKVSKGEAKDKLAKAKLAMEKAAKKKEEAAAAAKKEAAEKAAGGDGAASSNADELSDKTAALDVSDAKPAGEVAATTASAPADAEPKVAAPAAEVEVS